MLLYIRSDHQLMSNVVLREQFSILDIPFVFISASEVLIVDPLPNNLLPTLLTSLKKYGIELLENQKSINLQKIKDTIIDLVNLEDNLPTTKISTFLAEKLNLSYTSISNIFSELTHTNIEYFIILQRIEKAKMLILEDNLSFTEIAWKLNYSSLAHFSGQFKKVTGLTPSYFKKIVRKRKTETNNN